VEHTHVTPSLKAHAMADTLVKPEHKNDTFLGSWAGALAMLATAVAMFVVARHAHNIDFEHMYRPVKALLDGNWQGLYPSNTAGTSPTGWVLLTAIPTFIFSQFVGVSEAFTLANLLVLPGLLFASRFTAKALWPHLSNTHAWGLAAATVWLPSTLATYMNAYHPQDLAATVLIIAGIGLIAKRQWWWAGIVFGLAIMTRQWALLGLLPALGFSGKNIWKVCAAAGIVGVALTAPVLIVGGNEGWLTAFSAKSAAPVGDTVLGRFRYEATSPKGGNADQDIVFFLARLAPLVVAFGLGVVAWVRRQTRPELLVGFVVSGLALRMVFETANYLYYWVPFAALFVLLVPYKKAAWLAVGVFAFVPWALDSVYPPIGTMDGGVVASVTEAERLTRAVVAFLLSVGAMVACYLLIDSSGDETRAPEDDDGSAPSSWWRFTLGVVALVAVFVPFTIGGVTPSPISRLREINEKQQQSQDMLREQGVDVGTGRAGRLEE
jgi:hypothetical protein